MSLALRIFILRTPYVLAAGMIVLIMSNRTQAQPAFFMGLGDLPGGEFFSEPKDISADGSVVMGVSLSSIVPGVFGGGELFRWTRETGMVGIGGGTDGGQPRLSGDGSTIIGSLYPSPCVPCNATPFRWTKNTGFEQLPLNSAIAVSGDGSIVLGTKVSDSTERIAVWTPANGIQTGLFDNLGPTFPPDISADASVILGQENIAGTPNEYRYFTWSAAEGITYLGTSSNSWAQFPLISDNGKVVVSGNANVIANPLGAWRWSKETGAIPIGPLPDGRKTFSARGVSADGSIVVGDSERDLEHATTIRTSECCGRGVSSNPFIWDEFHGPRYLFDVLRNDYGLGAALAGWKDVSIIAGVSADGRTITGLGVNPAGKGEAWIAFLGTPVPEPSTLALCLLALAQLAWFHRGGR